MKIFKFGLFHKLEVLIVGTLRKEGAYNSLVLLYEYNLFFLMQFCMSKRKSSLKRKCALIDEMSCGIIKIIIAQMRYYAYSRRNCKIVGFSPTAVGRSTKHLKELQFIHRDECDKSGKERELCLGNINWREK